MMKFLKNHIKDPAHLDADTLAQYTKEDGSSSTSKPEVKDESGSEGEKVSILGLNYLSFKCPGPSALT